MSEYKIVLYPRVVKKSVESWRGYFLEHDDTVVRFSTENILQMGQGSSCSSCRVGVRPVQIEGGDIQSASLRYRRVLVAEALPAMAGD